MSKFLKRAAVGIMTIALLASCGKGGGGKNATVILVSAAASLKDSLEPIARDYERGHPGIDIQFNYGSSGTLQKQIEQGAPADLFLSAGKKQMDSLIVKKLISESREVLANRLVLILRSGIEGPVKDVNILLDSQVRRIAIGEPDTVPAGIYARQALTSLGLWDKLKAKLVYAQDVRQVLTFVETGNADAGLVYLTDVQASGKVKSAMEFPADSHDPIIYPFGRVAGTKHPGEAADFYKYLASEPAMRVFREHGFQQP